MNDHPQLIGLQFGICFFTVDQKWPTVHTSWAFTPNKAAIIAVNIVFLLD